MVVVVLVVVVMVVVVVAVVVLLLLLFVVVNAPALLLFIDCAHFPLSYGVSAPTRRSPGCPSPGRGPLDGG